MTRQFDIPGADKYAIGVKTLAEATWIRDHMIAQLHLAAVAETEQERVSRLQFLVVGGGYAGTETAAYLQRLTTEAAKRYPNLDGRQVNWHLVDIAERLLPEPGDKLGDKALKILRNRGVNVSLGVSVAQCTEDTVTLTDGRALACRTVIWTAGVAPSPLIATMGAPTIDGRLVVNADLTVPGCRAYSPSATLRPSRTWPRAAVQSARRPLNTRCAMAGLGAPRPSAGSCTSPPVSAPPPAGCSTRWSATISYAPASRPSAPHH